MTRIVGFLLLQCAAVLFAYQRSGSRKKQMEALRSYCDLLQQLHGILGADAPPMPELLQLLQRRCGGEARTFVERLSASLDRLGESSFQKLWQQALRMRDSALDRETAQDLEALGAVLGRYELSAQLHAAESCRSALNRRLDEMRSAQPQAVRLTFGLSLSAALLLGILLI